MSKQRKAILAKLRNTWSEEAVGKLDLYARGRADGVSAMVYIAGPSIDKVLPGESSRTDDERWADYIEVGQDVLEDELRTTTEEQASAIVLSKGIKPGYFERFLVQLRQYKRHTEPGIRYSDEIKDPLELAISFLHWYIRGLEAEKAAKSVKAA